MQSCDDKLIFEKYQQLNEIFGGYGWSPLQRGLAALGGKTAQGKVDIEKQANRALSSLKRDAAQAGYDIDNLNDVEWFTNWLSYYLGTDLSNNLTIQRDIKSKQEPFDIIKKAIQQSNVQRFKSPAPTAPAPTAPAPTTPAPTTPAPTTPAPTTPVTASKAASNFVKAIKSLTPGEIAFIKQNLP